MPGSVTIGHTDALVMLSHDDAKRLSTMLGQMAHMLDASGASRLDDAQVGELCQGRATSREELTGWCRNLSQYLAEHL
ncbi:hypothetical protein [Kitasatospora sp. DSM 101779]|uniref:hypothetical protein n=1 Tax=Kitasatospora sp. DSM 101779 TaxID=2853165 RepID=UPI0021D7E580|nr:hypothetical protein [Kitasatospora sp. DSM 101779]MCU7824074.1 hypothetical protein [Kitasatospora sp. DSM 101779]